MDSTAGRSMDAGAESSSGLDDERFRVSLLAAYEAWVLAGEQRERAVMLDRAGRALLIKEGGIDRVVWRRSELEPLFNRVYLITHNHPRGTSLTPEDLDLARIVGAHEVNAVTPTVRYRLYRTDGAWPPMESVRQAIDEIDAVLANEIQRRLTGSRITEQRAELLYYRVLWTRVADRFSEWLRYRQERRR